MKTNEDVMKRLLGTFDSIISSNRKTFSPIQKKILFFFCKTEDKTNS